MLQTAIDSALDKLINIDKDWIPNLENHALYIRPFMISTDEAIGVRPSDKYKFMIILSPTGPYYANPMRIYQPISTKAVGTT